MLLRTGKSAAVSFALLAFAWIVLLSDAVYARRQTEQLTETIAKVKMGKTLTARTEAAEHLAELTRGINPKTVDDKSIGELVSLLDTSEDSVRYWVPASLGNLGLRAKVAVPALLRLLPVADCLRGSKTSESGIRFALNRMGVTPPPPTCSAESKPE